MDHSAASIQVTPPQKSKPFLHESKKVGLSLFSDTLFENSMPVKSTQRQFSAIIELSKKKRFAVFKALL